MKFAREFQIQLKEVWSVFAMEETDFDSDSSSSCGFCDFYTHIERFPDPTERGLICVCNGENWFRFFFCGFCDFYIDIERFPCQNLFLIRLIVVIVSRSDDNLVTYCFVFFLSCNIQYVIHGFKTSDSISITVWKKELYETVHVSVRHAYHECYIFWVWSTGVV